MNSASLRGSEIRSPTEQATLEKSRAPITRPTYGFQFIEEFDPKRYGELKEEFEFADLNKNGTLSRQELEKYLENKMRNYFHDEYRPHFVDEIFGKMDENYDGIVTLEEFSHFYYRIEDDFNLQIKRLKEENEELAAKKKRMENDIKTAYETPTSFVHLKIIQGNFTDSDLKWTSSDVKHIKLRVSVDYHQGKDRSKEQHSRTIFSTMNPIWNDILIFECDPADNMNFTIKVELMEKLNNRKLEVKKELGRYNIFYARPTELIGADQVIRIMDSQIKTNCIGIIELKFEFIQNQLVNKERGIMNMRDQTEKNLETIKAVEKDLKYLKVLFGMIPKIPKPAPKLYTYSYSFFDNFNLYHQPIDEFLPKLGVDLETNNEYLKIWEILLFKYFPFMIFFFCLIICFNRADYLTLCFILQLLPYCWYEWLKFQFLYAKLILLLIITTDFFWLIFTYPEWEYSNLAIGQGGHAMNCITWVLSLMNFFIKILYEIFLIYIFHKVRHGYGYNLPEVKNRKFTNRADSKSELSGI